MPCDAQLGSCDAFVMHSGDEHEVRVMLIAGWYRLETSPAIDHGAEADTSV